MRSLTDKGIENRDYRDVIEITIDEKGVFNVHDGETEDNNLCRNFNSCWSILRLMKRAYEAGKKGDSFETEHIMVDEI